MKKISVILLCFIILFNFVACSNSAGSSSDKNTEKIDLKKNYAVDENNDVTNKLNCDSLFVDFIKYVINGDYDNAIQFFDYKKNDINKKIIDDLHVLNYILNNNSKFDFDLEKTFTSTVSKNNYVEYVLRSDILFASIRIGKNHGHWCVYHVIIHSSHDFLNSLNK